ncbi:DNA/RNA non-specific endonuclease [Allochromatium palmeri]|uniref:Endonuclease n=1 Tax=Allochromatium palmeri TaxID=231048 RepID=A0A6N8EKS3_9GAMM|nr:DNA/RNA non-specific endonuclease [Allochromatium palmeri]MTW23167.1 hypothetical protein [Allochromatium palmeri]
MQRVRAGKSGLAWPHVLQGVLGLFLIVPGLVEAGCPGCCSSHGGIVEACTPSGFVYCADGTVSPSCTCTRCGISPAPDPIPEPDPEPNPLTFGDCLSEFPNNTPPVVEDLVLGQQRALCFDSFAVLHSGESKTPLFVAEHLNRDRLLDAADEERTDYFYEEARLPSAERAKLSDYAGSGHDRGHMAPAADMPNPNAMAQSFSLANIVPQAPTLNRGLWAEIEDETRDYVWDWDAEVYVPTNLYKLIYDSDRNQAWAYWVDNLDEEDRADRISYETLVERTGIDFLPGIDPQFVPGVENYYTLSLSKAGQGTITSSPNGIDCGSTCSGSFEADTTVMLSATPAVGSLFNGWSGACSGTASTCTVNMDSSKTVLATFMDDDQEAAEGYYRKVNAYFYGTFGRSATADELTEWGAVLRDNKGSVWKPQGAGLQHYLSNEMGWDTDPVDRDTATSIVSEIFQNLFGTADDIDPRITSFYVEALVSGSVKPRGAVNAILNDLAIMPRVDGSYGQPKNWTGGPGQEILTSEQFNRYRERIERFKL